MIKRFLAFASVTTAACASHVEMRPIDIEAWRKAKKPAKGVIAYEMRMVKVTYEFTTLVSKDGAFLGSSNGAEVNADSTLKLCKKEIQKEEIHFMPDLSRAVLVSQSGGFLATRKLTVTLANGVVSSVNAEAAPQTPQLLTALAGIADVITTEDVKGLAACNAGPQITLTPMAIPGE